MKGRHVELPCEIGDTVYAIIEDVDVPYIHEDTVIAFEIWNKNGEPTLLIRTIYGIYIYGEKIALKREEAEKLLNTK